MVVLILSSDFAALRQTHSRSSPHFHSYGSFSIDVSGSCTKSQWPVYANSLLSGEPFNIHPPTKLILGIKLIENLCSFELPPSSLWLPITLVYALCWCSTSHLSPCTQNPVQHQMHFLTQQLDHPVPLLMPSRFEAHYEEPELCCMHTSLEIQWCSIPSVPLPPRTCCFSPRCCPLLPLMLVLASCPTWESNSRLFQRGRGTELNAKNVHAISVRDAVFVPHITWPCLYSIWRGRQGD